MSVAAYQFGQPDGPLFYWGILPGAPFLLFAGLSLIARVPLRVTCGATAGCFLAVAVPYGMLMYSSANYSGGGANIGLGILLLATPVLLPIAMVIGGFGGWLYGKKPDRA